MADEAKAKGNSCFSAGKFDEAITHFTEAIALAPTNHVLYSNRSASYASINKYQEALEDADKCLELNSSWGKGYSRKGAALVGMGQHAEAAAAFKKGLEVDPANEALKQGLADAEAAMKSGPSRGGFRASGGPFDASGPFAGPDAIVKLAADPRTRAYLDQPDFMAMLRDVQRNPSMLTKYFQDPRMMQSLGVLMGVSFSTAPGGGEDEEGANAGSSPSAREQAKSRAAPEPEPMEEEEVPEEEREKRKRKAEAQQLKEEGNAAYKKKQFDEAIAHYTRALELDEEDMTFLTNRAAVYLEMGKYEECIADCDKAVEKGRDMRADYKVIARALTRKGTALAKMAKTAKDWESAIEAFNKALTEHRNPDTLKKLNDAERTKKELETQEAFNPEEADQEREKGNDAFKKADYPLAVKHYTEALRRNPKDVRVYSNRAACYTKLTAMPEALKDAEKCIELDPAFSKGYSRKGAVQFFMKEYEKALATYEEGLKHDPGNDELKDGIKRCLEQINKAVRGDLTEDEMKERREKAQYDPEVQHILSDPVMRQVLTDMQENAKAAQEHLRNPMIKQKINKLVAAGIVQVR